MYKKWMCLFVSVIASALCAQGKQNLDQEDVLAVFKQYNPSALEKAASNETYGKILHQLATSFSMPNTDENQAELIALAKNFDNSLQLYAVRYAYFEARTLQKVSGTDLEALDQNTRDSLLPVVQSIYDNTMEVKNLQLARYKQRVKQTKKDTALSAEQKKEQLTLLRQKIKSLKTEIRSLKKNETKQINNTVAYYLKEIQDAYDKAQAEQMAALQSSSHNVKANHKKPVAK